MSNVMRHYCCQGLNLEPRVNQCLERLLRELATTFKLASNYATSASAVVATSAFSYAAGSTSAVSVNVSATNDNWLVTRSSIVTVVGIGSQHGTMQSGRLGQKHLHLLMPTILTSLRFNRYRSMLQVVVISTSECVGERLAIVGASIRNYDFATFTAKLSVARTD